jgi:hypothetical protein
MKNEEFDTALLLFVWTKGIPFSANFGGSNFFILHSSFFIYIKREP